MTLCESRKELKVKTEQAASLKFLQHTGAQLVLFEALSSSLPGQHCGEELITAVGYTW